MEGNNTSCTQFTSWQTCLWFYAIGFFGASSRYTYKDRPFFTSIKTRDRKIKKPDFLFQGESNKEIVLQTKPDGILEGEEEFTLSLVFADNNADISNTDGDVIVKVLADEGAAGLVSILPNSTYLIMGEPTSEYNGKAEVSSIDK